MSTDTEGMAVATTCLMQTLIASLVEKEVISPFDVANLVGEAEGYLAGLRPDIMSPDAREYARKSLQLFGKIFGGDPPGRGSS